MWIMIFSFRMMKSEKFCLPVGLRCEFNFGTCEVNLLDIVAAVLLMGHEEVVILVCIVYFDYIHEGIFGLL